MGGREILRSCPGRIPSFARDLASQMRHRHAPLTWPVPVGLIAQREGARVVTGPAVSDGAVSRSGDGYVIKLSLASPPRRKRYTLAHELGHIVYDRIEEARSPDPSQRTNLDPSHDARQEERFCEAFASYLLVPTEAIADLARWHGFSITGLVDRANHLQVSLQMLVWRVLEEAPYEGGALWFRRMGKPTDPSDVRLRLDWGVFPKSDAQYLPRYGSIPEESPIAMAFAATEERLHARVQLELGSLRGEKPLLMKAFGDRLLAIVLPPEIDPSIVRPSEPASVPLPL